MNVFLTGVGKVGRHFNVRVVQ